MAAGATYFPIATNTVSGTGTSSITFSSIPSTYTDLILVCNTGIISGTANLGIRVGNGSVDTGSNYSITYLTGNGSSASSTRLSNQTIFEITYVGGMDSTLNSNQIVQFSNYANTTTNKTLLSRNNRASLGVDAAVGLWRSTSAINIITCTVQVPASNWLAGSTFTLYGIEYA